MATDERPDLAAAVLAVVASTSPGTLLTYGEVAAEAGRPGAARAVGRIMAREGADVPWWRVVPASGRLAPAVAARQAPLLRREGIEVVDGRIRRPGRGYGRVSPRRRQEGAGMVVPGAVHHFELYVRDLERSSAFWGWLLAMLGYEPFQEWDEGISWRLPGEHGAADVALVQAPDGAADLDRRSVGLNHVAFAVDDREVVDRITDELRAREERVLYPDRHPFAGGEGHYAVFFEDPDGLKLEVVAD